MYIKGALPGEQVIAEFHSRQHGTVLEILVPSPDRIPPPCPLYSACGGCALQHLREDAYRTWKISAIRDLLAREGLAAPPLAFHAVPPSSRRRATFAARKTGRELILGYHGSRSHRIVDIPTCLILAPALNQHISALRPLLAALLEDGQQVSLLATLCDNGLDINIDAASAPERDQRLRVGTPPPFLRRITWRSPGEVPDLLYLDQAPRLTFGKISLFPPPHCFLQPSRPGEKFLQDFVANSLAASRRIVDLYSGVGTLSLPLAPERRIFAYDQSAPAIEALSAALAHEAPGSSARQRDLVRSPLTEAELAPFDAAIIDPPRAGALEQCRIIAASRLSQVAMVSCNARTFARDAACLTASGYRLEKVAILDQFAYSSHSEIAALFTH